MPTEKQAEAMWCPFVRYTSDTDSGSWGRGTTPENPANVAANGTSRNYSCNCIGSRCMAWRWADTSLVIRAKRDGFCGLSQALEDGYIR